MTCFCKKNHRTLDIINNTVYQNGAEVDYFDIFSNNCRQVNIINNIMYSRNGGKCNMNPTTVGHKQI